MNPNLIKELLGWTATAAFAASYLCRGQGALRSVQAVAALLWIAYGFATGSMPVIASNTAVAFMAVIYPVVRQSIERAQIDSPSDESTSVMKAPPFEELPPIF